MSAIFLSHSSKDNSIAIEIAAYLKAKHHRSLFLDFDPEHGIPPGRQWEQELYRQLRLCQAVIVLWSKNAADSKWVFAEITHAKSLGKTLLPIKVAPSKIPPILDRAQVLDFTEERAKAYKELERWLTEEANLDAQSAFDWDGSRAPYPGLLAFDSRDAAIFFGRDAEIHSGLDQLRSLQRLGGARAVLVLGASGSGKSSLVRAGLLPNLELDRDSWIVVPPIRPQPRPFPKTDPFKELAIALSSCFKEHNLPRDWRELWKALATETPPPSGFLEEVVEGLRIDLGRREATVLLTIDQLEELFTNADPAKADSFLALLRMSLSDRGIPLMLLCTLRSDFFQQFQQHSQAHDFAFEILSVRSMSPDQWVNIIEKPAERAGLRLEPSLVSALVRDTETEDALPLLAFTLRELWEQFGKQDGLLTLKEYRDGLGGLVGSVAKVAESVFTAQSCSQRQMADLRRVFSSLLVSVDAEGAYVQQTARWTDLPAGIHDVIEQFVQKRLLISRLEESERDVEIAHAALFRSWTRLEEWLHEEREFLLWRRWLRMRLADWNQAGDNDLLLRGVRLAEAERWDEERSAELLSQEREFIQASRDEETDRQKRWQELYHRAVARQLAAQSELVRSQRAGLLQRSVLLAVESLRRSPSLEGVQALRRGAALLPMPCESMNHRGMVTSLAFSSRGGYIAAGGGDEVRIWETSNGKLIHRLEHEGVVEAIAFTPDGTHLASASWDATARIWDVESGQELVRMQHEGQLQSLDMSPDGAWIATTAASSETVSSLGQIVWLWRCADGFQAARLEHDGSVGAMAFSPDGLHMASSSWKGTVFLWELPHFREVRRFTHPDAVTTLVFRPDSRWLATGCDANGVVRVWDLTTGQELKDRRLQHGAGLRALAFSPDGSYLAAASRDQTVRLWEAATGREIARMFHEDEVHALSFHPDGRYLATASRGYVARLWGVPSGREIARAVHESAVNTVAFSIDGRYLATGSGHIRTTGQRQFLEDAGARLWDLESGWTSTRVRHQASIADMAFSPGGRYLASASWDGTARLWSPSTGNEVARMIHGAKVISVVIDSREKYIATAGGDSVVLWEIGSSRKIRTLAAGPVTAGGRALAISPDGCWLATGGLDHKARLWQVNTGREAFCWEYDDTVGCVVFSPDGHCLATICADEIHVRNTATGRSILKLNLKERLSDLRWTPDGHYLLARPISSVAFLLNAANGATVAQLSHQDFVKDCAVSPDGSHVATNGNDAVRLWEIPGGREVLQLKIGSSVRGVCFAPDSAHLGLACEDHTARVYSVPGGREVARLSHESSLIDIAFDPDGRYLAATGGDDSIAISLWRESDLFSAAYARLVRNLNADEWQEYLGDEPYDKTCPHLPIHESIVQKGLDLALSGDLEGALRIFQRVIALQPEYEKEFHLDVAIARLKDKIERGEHKSEHPPD